MVPSFHRDVGAPQCAGTSAEHRSPAASPVWYKAERQALGHEDGILLLARAAAVRLHWEWFPYVPSLKQIVTKEHDV